MAFNFSVPSVETVIRFIIGAIAAAASMFVAYWALTVIMWLLSWLIVIIGTVAIGTFAGRYASEHGYNWLVDKSAGVLNVFRRKQEA